MKTIVFILNSIQHPRCAKRIDEFLSRGYTVAVYGFSRENGLYIPKTYRMLGMLCNKSSYFSRFKLMYNAIRKVANQYDTRNTIFYYFGLDVAMAGRCATSIPYIYEESDLAHTYIKRCLFRKTLEWIDRFLIKRSEETIFTSEGFSLYHFNNNRPNNVTIIPNKLNEKCLYLKYRPIKNINLDCLNIGFVGGVRFYSVLNLAKVFALNFPNCTFHFFGSRMPTTDKLWNKLFEECVGIPNVKYHGAFNNPEDLPGIYAQIDMVVATYDVTIENVRYAEPNKIYEAIFFETPIIVSNGTFLSQKVNSLGIGFGINPLDEEEIVSFFKQLTKSSLIECSKKCALIDKREVINNNDVFFYKLKNKGIC